MATADTPQAAHALEAIIPIASLIVLVALSYYLFGDAGALGPNQVALVLATMIVVFIAWRRGHMLDSRREAAIESVGSGIDAPVGKLTRGRGDSGTVVFTDDRRRIGMKTKALMVLFLVALAGCAAKKQQVIQQATEECIQARDAAVRAQQSCEQCCNRPAMRK